jgi:hypothetical protein
MPTVTSVTTTYAGEFAKKYIAATLLASKTVDNVTQHLNINNKYVIKKYANAASFDDLRCDFTPTGTLALTELILDPKQLQWQQKLCKKDFLLDWETMQMGFGNNRTLPPLLGDFMLQEMAKTVTSQVETLMWQGEVATTGEFDGFYAQLGSVDVNGAIITASNVIAEMNKVVNAIPAAVKAYRAEDLVIYVPTSVMFFYAQAQAALGAFDAFSERFAEPKFLGIQLVECPGMLDNTMVAARKSNMHFATGLMADFTDVRLIDQALIDGSENVNVTIKFSGDTAIGFQSEAVYYAYQS